MSEELIRLLRSLNPDIEARTIADALWLATYLPQSDALSTDEIDGPDLEDEDFGDEDGDEVLEDGDGPAHGIESQPATQQDDAVAETLAPPTEADALTVSVGTEETLAARSAIQRALKPLFERRPSQTRTLLDEQETAESTAEALSLVIKMSPELEHWSQVEIVVDMHETMMIWEPIIEEFIDLIQGLGMAQRINTWGLWTDNHELELQSFETGFRLTGQRCSPRKIAANKPGQIILVISDCVSPAWRSGDVVQEALDHWSRNCACSVLQMLPENLWPRTALAASDPGRLRAARPLSPNTDASFYHNELVPKFLRQTTCGVPIPFVTLDSDSLKNWIQFLVGRGRAVGLLLHENPNLPVANSRNTQLSAQERVKRFRNSASPEARRLAGYLAHAPLRLPLMQLIQRVMLPDSRQSHLAEVWLGGLIQRNKDDDWRTIGNRTFAFHKGVQELLLGYTLRQESVRVIQEVIHYSAAQHNIRISAEHQLAVRSIELPKELIQKDPGLKKATEPALQRLRSPEATVEIVSPGEGRPPELKTILWLAQSEGSDAEREHRLNEFNIVKNAIGHSRFRNRFELINEIDRNMDQLLGLHQPDVVHFSSTTLKIENSSVLEQFAKAGVKVVVLNYSSSRDAAEAIVKYVPLVIGTTTDLRDDVAGGFSQMFYRGLADGDAIWNAATGARSYADKLADESVYHISRGAQFDEEEALISGANEFGGTDESKASGQSSSAAETGNTTEESQQNDQPAEGKSKIRRRFALLIGVGNPLPSNKPLLSVDDSQPFEEMQDAFSRLGNVEVKTLWRDEATRERIEAELQQVRNELEPDDLIYVHLAGRFMQDGKSPFFLPFDFNRSSPDGISVEDVRNLLRQSSATSVLIYDMWEVSRASGDVGAQLSMADLPGDHFEMEFSYPSPRVADLPIEEIGTRQLAQAIRKFAQSPLTSPNELAWRMLISELKESPSGHHFRFQSEGDESLPIFVRRSRAESNEPQRPFSRMRFDVLAAGRGKCIFIDFGTDDAPRLMMIDGGGPRTYREVLRRMFESWGPDLPSISPLVLTHIHDDHSRGVLDMFRDLSDQEMDNLPPAVRVESFWSNLVDTDDKKESERKRRLRNDLKRLDIRSETVGAGDRRSLSNGVDVVILTPSKEQIARYIRAQSTSQENTTSIAMLVQQYGYRALFPSDQDVSEVLRALRREGFIQSGRMPVDLLAFPHVSNPPEQVMEFFETVIASAYLITDDGRWNSPRIELIEQLLDFRKGDKFTLYFSRAISSFDDKYPQEQLRELLLSRQDSDGFKFVEAEPKMQFLTIVTS